MLKYLNPSTLAKTVDLFGNFEMLAKKKVIHCVNLYLKDYDQFDWFFVKNFEEAPKISEDSFTLMYIRSLCDGIINSVYI